MTDTNTLPMHGGDLDAANARYGTPAVGWLDLSTGINQTAYPIGNVPSETWQSLPSRSALDRTLAAARNAYAAKPDTPIVAAPGAQAIIQVLPQLRRNARVAIVGPTYSEHARAWANAGARVSAITEVDLHAADDVDVVVVV
ncbi:MAG: threonine-phosphate decarboxylase, partial [Pseudomonadota bacterium]